MTPRQKRHLYNFGGIFLSLLFIYFCYRLLEKDKIGQIFSIQRPWLLVPVVFMNFGVMALRAEIWRYMLNYLVRIPYTTLFDILNVGYMANNLLPLKAGDFFRASFVSRRWKTSYTPVLTTVGLERYFSGLSLLVLFFILAAFLQIPWWIKTGVYGTGAVLLTVQAGLLLIWKKKPNLDIWKKRHPLIFRIVQFFAHVGEGSAPLKSPKGYLILIFYSLIAWFAQAIMLRFIEVAYGVHVDWASTVFVVAAINLAIVLPTAPGNLGTFELAAILAYTFVGVDRATALGMGIFFHFLQVIPVTLLGLVFYFRWGLRFQEIERVAEDRLEEVIS